MAREFSFGRSHSDVRPLLTAVRVLLPTERLAIGEIRISQPIFFPHVAREVFHLIQLISSQPAS